MKVQKNKEIKINYTRNYVKRTLIQSILNDFTVNMKLAVLKVCPQYVFFCQPKHLGFFICVDKLRLTELNV